MTTKDENFGKDEKIKHEPFSNTHSSFQSECVRTLSEYSGAMNKWNIKLWRWSDTAAYLKIYRYYKEM